jgi:Ni2+-binding GTPase involved in maturation of urease and hydrogenase
VEGTVSTLSVQIEKSLVCKGAVTQGIKKITAEEYEVANDDHTILCDSVGGSINVTLPPACNNTGRVLVIKKTNTDKYNLKSHPVTIKVSEGKIDLTDIVTLKMNYSSRTLQSDGANWWIIGQKGT